MALKRLVELSNLAEKNLNGEKIKPLRLSIYATHIEDEETPMRFYQASMCNNDGMLLVTDRRLFFIGEDEDGNIDGIDILLGDIDHVDVAIPDDKSIARLIVDVSGETFEYDMLRFGIDRLVEHIEDNL